MAGRQPPNGDIPPELTVANPYHDDKATARLDYGDAAFCYGSIDARMDVVKEPLEDDRDTMIQCDVNISDSTRVSSEMTSDVDAEEENEPCGWGPLAPTWCQMFRNPKVFLFCLCWAGAIQVSLTFQEILILIIVFWFSQNMLLRINLWIRVRCLKNKLVQQNQPKHSRGELTKNIYWSFNEENPVLLDLDVTLLQGCWWTDVSQ